MTFLDVISKIPGLIAYVRQGRFDEHQTILFWHTGGQVALFQ